MKYKAGEKVRVRKDLKVGKVYGGNTYISSMQLYAGDLVTIWKPFSIKPKSWLVKENDYAWTDEMLESKTLDNLKVGDIIRNPNQARRKILGVCGEVYMCSLASAFTRAGYIFTSSQLEKSGWEVETKEPKKKLKHYLKKYGKEKVLKILAQLDEN